MIVINKSSSNQISIPSFQFDYYNNTGSTYIGVFDKRESDFYRIAKINDLTSGSTNNFYRVQFEENINEDAENAKVSLQEGHYDFYIYTDDGTKLNSSVDSIPSGATYLFREQALVDPINQASYITPSGTEGIITPVPTCPQLTANYLLQFNYPSQSEGFSQRWKSNAKGTIDFDSYTGTNINFINFYLNGSQVTGSQSLSFQDTIETVAVFSNPLLSGSVILNIDVDTSATITEEGKSWVPCIWGHQTTNGIVDGDWIFDRNVYLATGSTSGWIHSDVDKYRFSGTGWEVRFKYEHQTFFGVSFGAISRPAIHYQGFDYAIQGVNGTFQLYELGSLIATFPSGNAGMMMKLQDTGSAIAIYYSSDDGVTWTFWRNAVSYTPNETYYCEMAIFNPYNRNTGMEILGSHIKQRLS